MEPPPLADEEAGGRSHETDFVVVGSGIGGAAALGRGGGAGGRVRVGENGGRGEGGAGEGGNKAQPPWLLVRGLEAGGTARQGQGRMQRPAGVG